MPAPVSAIAVLETKLYAPRRPAGLVTRPSLVERIRRGVRGKLTLIAAPPGFGKTTILAEWLAHRDPDEPLVAWVSLDPGDNEPALFWTCIVRALQRVSPGLGQANLAAIQSEGAPSQATLTALLNEVSTLDVDLALVLDDYHVIETPAIHTALAFLLDHLPPPLHVVLATRADPPLPVARMRARGEVTELRADDLRFTTDEASAFFSRALPFELDTADVSALEERTEGWIAGLKLAALSMPGREAAREFVRSFAGDHRYVADYLVEEVLEREPEPTRRFLLTTCILERLSAPLCDAVTGERGSQALLDSLERRNLFVVALDDRREWYRYHHLFADVLQTHAAREDPGSRRDLHRRASAWFEEHGAVPEAVRHAEAADDVERVAGLLERHWPPKDRSYASRRWLERVKSLPGEVVARRPGLNMGYAWGLLNAGELETAELRLGEVEASIGGGGSTSPLAREAATARLYLAQSRGDHEGTLEHARRVLELVPPGDPASRATALALFGLAQWSHGALEAAHDTFAAALASMRDAGADLDAIRGAFVCGDIRMMQGRLREAARTYEAGLALAAARPEAEADELFLGLAEVHLERGEVQEAHRLLDEIARAATETHHAGNRHRWCLVMSRVALARGESRRALELLSEAEAHHRRDPLPIVRPVAAMKARIRLAEGDVDGAERWATEHEVRHDDALGFLREFEHITLARILIARGSHPDAIDLLARLGSAAHAGERQGRLIETLALASLAYQGIGRPREAFESLGRALDLAEGEGHVQVFVSEKTPMRDLLRQVTARGIGGAWTRRVLTGFEVPEEPLRPAGDGGSLTRREHEILRLIAAGMRNQEIARQLFISPATVKRHIANVYGKLNASHRTDALRRAADLHLL